MVKIPDEIKEPQDRLAWLWRAEQLMMEDYNKTGQEWKDKKIPDKEWHEYTDKWFDNDGDLHVAVNLERKKLRESDKYDINIEDIF